MNEELRLLERSPSVAAREVHVNQLPLSPLLCVPPGQWTNIVIRCVLETVAPSS